MLKREPTLDDLLNDPVIRKVMKPTAILPKTSCP